jgi:hypothetical protein
LVEEGGAFGGRLGVFFVVVGVDHGFEIYWGPCGSRCIFRMTVSLYVIFWLLH